MSATLVSGQRATDDRLLERAQAVGQAEMARLLARTPKSAELYAAGHPYSPVRGGLLLSEDAALPHLRDPGKRQSYLGPGWE